MLNTGLLDHVSGVSDQTRTSSRLFDIRRYQKSNVLVGFRERIHWPLVDRTVGWIIPI